MLAKKKGASANEPIRKTKPLLELPIPEIDVDADATPFV